MNKAFRVLFLCVFSISVFFSTIRETKAMDPRIKALGIMAGYGTIGGALLGAASLAFGTKGRSVAIGASVGLYAGLLFGSYVVVSHAYRKHRADNPEAQENYYPDSKSLYEGEGGAPGAEDANYRYQRLEVEDLGFSREEKLRNFGKQKAKPDTPLLYFNLLNYQF